MSCNIIIFYSNIFQASLTGNVERGSLIKLTETVACAALCKPLQYTVSSGKSILAEHMGVTKMSMVH
jgi:hypothetical protein